MNSINGASGPKGITVPNAHKLWGLQKEYAWQQLCRWVTRKVPAGDAALTAQMIYQEMFETSVEEDGLIAFKEDWAKPDQQIALVASIHMPEATRKLAGASLIRASLRATYQLYKQWGIHNTHCVACAKRT